MGPLRRCRPWKGLAIPCGLRLVLNPLGGSETQPIYGTGH